MTDSERVELVRTIIFKSSKLNPAAMIDAIKSIVGEPPEVTVERPDKSKVKHHLPIYVPPIETKECDRFLRLKDLARYLGISAKSLVEKRCRGKLTLQLIKKDGMLGCFQSHYDEWRKRTDNQKLG